MGLGPTGWLVWNAAASLDFAGGTVVHINAGVAGAGGRARARQAQRLRPTRHAAAQPDADRDRRRHAVGRLVRLQRRQRGRRRRRRRHDACVDHHSPPRPAALVWLLAGVDPRGKPTVLGICSGAVAGLVAITPAAGFVGATGALVIGVAGRRRLLPGLHQLKRQLRLRRLAGHLRRARRGRHHRGAPHRASSPPSRWAARSRYPIGRQLGVQVLACAVTAGWSAP